MLTEFLHLMSNPAHWMFELASGAIVAVCLTKPAGWAWRRALARHDAEAHPEVNAEILSERWLTSGHQPAAARVFDQDAA